MEQLTHSLKVIQDHLETAHGVVSHLLGQSGLAESPSRQLPAGLATSPDQSDALELYRAAEKRANRAEAEVARARREIQLIRDSAASSVRDVQRLAYQDSLTGLANGHLLHEHVDSLCSSRKADFQVGLIIVDVDRFQVINEVFGHDLADQLLVRVAERLSQMQNAQLSVGRLSEDEFAIVVPNLPNAEALSSLQGLGQEIRRLLRDPFMLQGQRIQLTVSQGASVFPDSAAATRELFQQARTALALAKGQGRDRFLHFDSRHREAQQEDASLEMHLRYGIEDDEFFLEYLPIIWLDRMSATSVQGRLIGVEALLRWNHRARGVLPPSTFLHLAERSGLILPLGESLIAKVCRQHRLWKEAGADLLINVNLSGRQLLQSGLSDYIVDQVEASEIPRERLTLEFQEQPNSLEDEQIDATLNELATAGFNLALDGFGAGAFSIKRLCRARFLKLSPQLVQGSPELCEKALAMAASLGILAIGVGVETAQCAKFLVDKGCATVQGFYFSPPISHEQVLEMYQSRPTWHF